MIELDGTFEEGGGQIVRTALGLSVYTGKSFTVKNIREGRAQPGLKKQHLEAINALKILCNADVSGNELGSKEIAFDPGIFKGGKLEIDIETAGSITLLLQSLIVPMTLLKKRTSLKIIGGTDVPHSMPSDYFKNVFLPHIRKYAKVDFKIIKRGFYPKGNGTVEFVVDPIENKGQIILAKQGAILGIKGVCFASSDLGKRNVAERMRDSANMLLSKYGCGVELQTSYSDSLSSGAGIALWSLHSTNDEVDNLNPVILGADVLGEMNISSEDVSKECVRKLKEEIDSSCAVDKHLADNLIPFLGILGGKIKTSEITKHTLANIYVTEKFLDVKFNVDYGKKEISVVK